MMNEEIETFDEEEIEIETIGIDVSVQPIELYKVLKIANLVDGGGQAKHLISDGYVAVNGELETRKRRKMYDGDFFEFNQEYYVVICDQPVSERPSEKAESVVSEVPKKKTKSKSKKEQKPTVSRKKEQKESSPIHRDKESGRNSIDFF